jgi:hypothetical protein
MEKRIVWATNTGHSRCPRWSGEVPSDYLERLAIRLGYMPDRKSPYYRPTASLANSSSTPSNPERAA